MKLKPILIETGKAEDSIILSAEKLRFFKGYFTQDYLNSQDKKSYHIYLIDKNAELEEGDWCVDTYKNLVKYVKKAWGIAARFKIIASTDKSLGLPLLSEQAVNYLIEYYNKNNNIPEEVDVKEETYSAGYNDIQQSVIELFE